MSLALVAAATTLAHADSAPRTHDGFHFQLAGGLGYYNVSNDVQPFSGVTLPTQLLIGGTLFNGLAFGGGVVFDYSPSPSTDTPGVSSQSILGLGVYADYYLDAKTNGLHVQGFVGWGGLETSFMGNVGGSDPTGLVAHAGVGYEFWLTDQWSYGVMGRLTYAPVSLNGTSYTTIEPAVVGTLTWH
ncbi:MAG TPA: outer membrane beta-barrel protein [Kofleriaceae bacterium]|nr:outer membrane beta-barrel protein [Kofleriaceae bacterium]